MGTHPWGIPAAPTAITPPPAAHPRERRGARRVLQGIFRTIASAGPRSVDVAFRRHAVRASFFPLSFNRRGTQYSITDGNDTADVTKPLVGGHVADSKGPNRNTRTAGRCAVSPSVRTGPASPLARLHIRSRGRGRASTSHVMPSRDLRIASRPAPVACGPGRVCGRVHVILTVSPVRWPVRVWPPKGGGASVVSRRTGRLTRKPSGDTTAVNRRGMGASAKILTARNGEDMTTKTPRAARRGRGNVNGQAGDMTPHPAATG